MTKTVTGLVLGMGLFMATLNGCAKGDQEFSFSASANNKLKSTTLSSFVGLFDSRSASNLTTSCYGSYYCLTPTALTGKYFGVGLLIQADEQGMTASFGQASWSEITGTSSTYNFDMASPISNSGNLTCCGGQGDLNSDNTYISDVTFLFGYLDATFTISGSTGASGTAVGTHTVRFILADDVVTSAKRGDLMYKDSDLAFKWVDSGSGAMSTTRPTSPVTMNSYVVNYTNPWGVAVGNQSIPVVYASVERTSENGGMITVNEEELKKEGKTYSFNLVATGMVIFPGIIQGSDESNLNSIKTMLQYVHLLGLPHSNSAFSVATKAPNTTLTIE